MYGLMIAWTLWWFTQHIEALARPKVTKRKHCDLDAHGWNWSAKMA